MPTGQAELLAARAASGQQLDRVLVAAPTGDDSLRPGKWQTGQNRFNGGTVTERFVEIAGVEGKAVVHTDNGPGLIIHGTWRRVDARLRCVASP